MSVCQFNTVKVEILNKYRDKVPGIKVTDATGVDTRCHLH